MKLTIVILSVVIYLILGVFYTCCVRVVFHDHVNKAKLILAWPWYFIQGIFWGR